jgi:hypothetical protein
VLALVVIAVPAYFFMRWRNRRKHASA